jgi:hypothetical protein
MRTLYNKIFLSIVGALFLFAACEESITDRESSPVMPDDCIGVYFPTTSMVVELEPVEPTQITIDISRVDSARAVEVPITVDINTDDVFVVPAKASFAAGEKTTSITITFPSADEGVTYNLKLSVLGDEYVNKYASALPYMTANVTRIKWNVTTEPFIYVEGTFLTFFGVERIPMYVETEKAEVGNVVRYRFKNAYRIASPEPDADNIYDGYYYNGPGDVDETRDYYIVIEIDEDGKVSMIPSELGVDWGYGMFSIGSIYGNLSENINSYPLGFFEEGEEGGVITFPANSLYISMADYNDGAGYPCANPTIIYTTKAAYIAANLKIEDFNILEYEEIEGAIGEFESAAYSDSWNQSIAKAIDIDPDNEDSEYKNLYYLANLYADNHGLAFYYNGRVVSIPAKQTTGKQVLGKDVYVSQSESIESNVTTNSKGVDIYTLGLIFHFEDGTIVGEFAETFYYSKEPVAYELADFYGNFVMTGKSVFDDSDVEMNVSIAAGTEANTFVITGVRYAETIVATFDPQASVLLIVPQTLPDYGQYDITLYTVTQDWSDSETAALSFTFNMKGQLALTSNSEAIGYLLYSLNIGNWVDGYYDLLFAPQVAADADLATDAVSNPTGKLLNAISVERTQKASNGNFAVQGKLSAKTKLKRNLKEIF